MTRPGPISPKAYDDSPVSPWVAALISAAMVGVMAWVRLGLWRGNALPIGFGVPLIVFIWLRDRWLLWGSAIAFLAIAFAKHFVLRSSGDPDYSGPAFYVSLGSIVADTLFVAGAVHLLIGSRRDLRRQHEELRAANAELSARDEEISHQNEELQTQAEELEQNTEELRQQAEELQQQAEELRISNDELSRRERMLEALLKVSRSLVAQETQDQLLQRICEAAGPALTGEAAGAAVLMRDGDRFVVRGSWGFLADEQHLAWPVEKSVADLILHGGRTGFIEDLRKRPELIVPTPREGAAFQSVLASPLYVGGRPVGTLEIYSHEPRQWTSREFATIEWLAGQAAGVLETAELLRDIEREHRRFQTIFDSIPIALLVADDPECRVVRGNPAAAALYGAAAGANYSPLSGDGSRVERILIKDAAELAPGEFPIVRAVLAGEEVRGEVYEAVLPDGKCLSVMLSATPIRDGGGRIIGGACAMVDITEQHALQQELEHRRREAEEASVRKTRFLAAVSHDIRTPANAINLLAELIQRTAADPQGRDEVVPLVADLRSNATSLVALVSDVLDVARFDSDRVELQESDFEVSEMLREEMRKLAPVALSRSLDFSCEPCENPIWIRADRVKLGRVVNNLLGNAIKFTETGGVRLSAQSIDGAVHIRVADTGVGIAPEHLPHIFDEFYQLRNPERDRNKGTGLGLAICKRLVATMGGELTVSSEVGRGTTFTLSLPRVLSAGPATPSVTAPSGGDGEPSLRGLRIILVEDHAPTRRAAARLLEDHGAIVTHAADGRTALHILKDVDANVLLLDLMLPDIDGREVLRFLAESRPASLQQVIVLTGDVTPARIEEVSALGADGLMAKPVDMHLLIERLSRTTDAKPA